MSIWRTLSGCHRPESKIADAAVNRLEKRLGDKETSVNGKLKRAQLNICRILHRACDPETRSAYLSKAWAVKQKECPFGDVERKSRLLWILPR